MGSKKSIIKLNIVKYLVLIFLLIVVFTKWINLLMIENNTKNNISIDYMNFNESLKSLRELTNDNFILFKTQKEEEQITLKKLLSGKNLSILGDSISTYEGYSNDATNTNDTIGDNAIYYMSGDNIITTVDKTWWKKVAIDTGMNILVNNSYSGSKVYEEAESAGYKTRTENLHDNTGDNDGTEPDLIAIYIGINDFDNGVELGEYSIDIYNKLIINNMDGTFAYNAPTNFTEAYIVMIHKIINRYKNADIFCFTFVPNGVNKDYVLLEKYNDAIRKIAKQYNIDIVDLYNDSGINTSNYNSFNGDLNGLHPNVEGMDAIAKTFEEKMMNKYLDNHGANLLN